MTPGTLIEQVFGVHEWVYNLREYNVRFIEQLASLLATDQGRRALRLLDRSVPVENLQPTVKSFIEQKHQLSFAAPRAAGADGLSLLTNRRYKYGYALPSDLLRADFGDLLPLAARAAVVPTTFTSTTAGVSPSGTAAALPSRHDLKAHLTPVQNQFYRGACVAFATVALLETEIKARTKTEERLSEQYLFYATKLLDSDKISEGTYYQYALQALTDRGVCRAADWPYSSYNDWGQSLGFSPPPKPLATLDHGAAPFKITAHGSVPETSVADIKRQIAADKPVGAALLVFKDAWDNNGFVEATGEVQMPLTRPRFDGTEELLDSVAGGHAVAFVGYEDTPDPNDFNSYRPGGGYFVFKNSWGTGWAHASGFAPGYGILPYLYVEKYNQAAVVLNP